MIRKLDSVLLNKRKAYKKVLSTPEGEIVLKNLYKVCMMDKLPYVEGSNQKTNVNIGKQMIGHHIKEMMKHTNIDIDSIVKTIDS